MTRRRRWTHADADGGESPGGVLIDFSTGALPSSMTFTRASSAWGVNSAGVLTAYTTNQPRFVYDPATLANLGLLVEVARTNGLTNSTAAGTAAGTPGTTPNNWVTTGSGNGITQQVVGSGVEDGIEYWDIRISGTPLSSSTFLVNTDSNTAVAALNGQTWSGSMYLRLMAGSLTGLAAPPNLIGMLIVERAAGGGGLVSGQSNIAPTGAALRTQRFVQIYPTTNASTALISMGLSFGYTLSVPIDLTLRIGLPQLELGAGATSPVKTSTVAATRAVDVALVVDPLALTLPVLVVKARAQSYTDPTLALRLMAKDAGSSNDIVQITRQTNASINNNVTAGGVTQASLVMAIIADNADFAVAIRTLTNDFAASLNGGTVVTDVAGTLPAAPTVIRVGGSTSATLYWNSTIKSLELRSGATNAQLQTLSVP